MPEETKDTHSSTPGGITVGSDRKVTLVGVAEAGVCPWLWFGSLSLQNVLNQVLDAELSCSAGPFNTVN